MSVVACRVYPDRIEIAADSIAVRGWTQSKGANVNYSKVWGDEAKDSTVVNENRN